MLLLAVILFASNSVIASFLKWFVRTKEPKIYSHLNLCRHLVRQALV
jgi:hypothetical protein